VYGGKVLSQTQTPNLITISTVTPFLLAILSIEAFKRKYSSKPTTRKLKQKGRKKKTETPHEKID